MALISMEFYLFCIFIHILIKNLCGNNFASKWCVLLNSAYIEMSLRFLASFNAFFTTSLALTIGLAKLLLEYASISARVKKSVLTNRDKQ